MPVTNKAEIYAYIGSSGSGKSAAIKQHLEEFKFDRLIIWDPLQEYQDHGQVFTSLAECMRAALTEEKITREKFAVVYQPPRSDQKTKQKAFSSLCDLAMFAGDVALVIEELGMVTSPSFAPIGWKEACSTGRHKGLTIIAASQRPANVDKDFFGNCTLIQCGRLNYENDIRVMSNVLGVMPQQIKAMKPLEFVARDMGSGDVLKGEITFKK